MAKFVTSDVFGDTVIATFAAWDHVLRGHPEMAGRDDEVKTTIECPDAVYEGNVETAKVFVTSVTKGFWKGSHRVAVVSYHTAQRLGYLTTAYMAGSLPPRKKLWPSP